MFDSLRSFIARKISGPVEVHTIDDAFITELLPVHTVRKSVETYTLKPDITLSVKSIDVTPKITCKVSGINTELRVPKILGFRFKLLTKHDIKTHGIPRQRKINIWKATKKMQAVPIELENKIKFLKNKPSLAKNESLLAWYWPIVDSAVIKLALNKQRWTLLVWYNPGSRHAKPKGLYLIRRLGLGEKPEWRWV